MADAAAVDHQVLVAEARGREGRAGLCGRLVAVAVADVLAELHRADPAVPVRVGETLQAVEKKLLTATLLAVSGDLSLIHI